VDLPDRCGSRNDALDGDNTSAAAIPALRQQRQQGVLIKRLDQMKVKARLLRPPPVLVLAVTRNGHKEGILAAYFLPKPKRDFVAVHAGKADV
jgi:hypothetical protein